MKALVTFIALISLNFSGAYAQGSGWKPQTSSTVEGLLGVDFVTPRSGWVVGYDGIILKTSDRGSHWVRQHLDSVSTLASVSFVDTLTGWVVGYDTAGLILKTTDGGATWQRSSVFDPLVAVHFVSSSIGWTVTPDGFVMKSTDGGATWRHQTVPDSTVFYTSVFFLNADTGWVGGQIPATLLKTTDGGTTWASETSGIDPQESINGLFFLNHTTGWLVGFDQPSSVGIGVIEKSTDGGKSWINQTSGTDQYLLSISFADSNTGWAVGGSGTIIKTTDGGTTWGNDVSNVSGELDQIEVIPTEAAWIVGASGTILMNDFRPPGFQDTFFFVDNGWNMISVPLSTPSNLKSEIFPTIVGTAFGYNGGYIVADTLVPGNSYWIHTSQAETVLVGGTPIDSLTYSLSSGWNFVGGIYNSIPVGNIIQSPPNSIREIFYYSGQYFVADSIIRNKGYWMQSSAPCQITLKSNIGPEVPKEMLTDVSRLRSDEPPPPAPGQDLISARRRERVPSTYSLGSNYPNPFNPTTRINFDLPEKSLIHMSVFNILGQEVSRLIDGTMDAGYQSVEWNSTTRGGLSVGSGIYFYRIDAVSLASGKHFQSVKKMILLK